MELSERQLYELAAGVAGFLALSLAVSRHRRRRSEAKAMLAGVRSMIAGDPDGAITALSDAARLGTPQALDTYLALGILLRRSGDLSRAIRLHKNMLLSPRLDPARRIEVSLELVQDYRQGGMLEEAAALLEPLARLEPRAAEALRELRSTQAEGPAAGRPR